MKEGRKEKEMVFLESNKFEFQTHFLALCWELFSDSWTSDDNCPQRYYTFSEENRKCTQKGAHYTSNAAGTAPTPAGQW